MRTRSVLAVRESVARRFINRNDVKRTDGMRNPFLVYDDNGFWMNRDEILVRHTNLFAARQFQRERVKAVFKPALYLFDNHGDTLLLRFPDATSQLQIRIRHRAERGARDVGGAFHKVVHVFFGLISPLNTRSSSPESFNSCAHCLM